MLCINYAINKLSLDLPATGSPTKGFLSSYRGARVSKMKLLSILLGIAVIGGILVFNYMKQEPAVARIILPENLSAKAVAGQAPFEKNCAQCHGSFGQGSDKGPPLIHDIYNPGHHGDQAFYLAAKRGVRAHHWRFGNMPRLAPVAPEVMQSIITFIREVQRANGIVYKAHKM